MELPKVNFPLTFDKDTSPSRPAVNERNGSKVQKKVLGLGGSEIAPPLSAIQIGGSSKNTSRVIGNDKSKNRCEDTAKVFGVSVRGPLGTSLFETTSNNNNSTASPGENPKPQEMRPLTEEELKEHMIYLPPRGALSNVSQMDKADIDKLAADLNAKTRNEILYEAQLQTATDIFKLVLSVKDQICHIIEVEFYREGDPYLHADFRLQQHLKFYFRRRLFKPGDDPSRASSDGTVLTTGKKRGLYVTIGREGFQCAVLIRSMITPIGVVEGAAEVLDYILGVFEFKSVDQLNQHLVKGLEAYNQQAKVDNKPTIELSRDLVPAYLRDLGLSLLEVYEKDHPYQGQRIFHGPRVGLHLKRETEYYGHYSLHLMRPFRFSYRVDLLKIAKHFFALTARIKEVPDLAIQEGMKISAELLGRWSSYFTRGETASIDMLMLPGNLSMDDVKKQCTAYGFFSRFNK